MSTLIYWFRNDLRLTDNPAFTLASQQALQHGLRLLPVFCHAPPETTRWGFARVGLHRQRVLADTLLDLETQLRSLGSALLHLHGQPANVMPALARVLQASTVMAEDIAAPQEQGEVAGLRAAGLTVQTVWQSSLLDPAELPFEVTALPAVFTQFRTGVEKAAVQVRQPLPAPSTVAPLPAMWDADSDRISHPDLAQLLTSNWPLAFTNKGQEAMNIDALDRASLPYHLPAFQGGERTGLAHLRRYLAAKLPHSYKATRNQLSGTDYSSKFSPWLASGALSAPTIYAELKAFEIEFGANDSSYWLWFELLWRDYFRFLHLQYGSRLYHAQGLRNQDGVPAASAQTNDTLTLWRQGQTGVPLVDAAMRELHQTGYLSNRLRQVVASHLIYDLGCDWRAGAAWFESQLVDFDIYSNQGNWLYIAGLGTDPRGGRHFNVVKQTQDHDPTGAYRALWLR